MPHRKDISSFLCGSFWNYRRFTDCYKRFYQLQPEMTQRIYDKFITQLQTSIRDEISEIKEEGNLEAVLNALDVIVEEGKDRREPAWRPSGIPEKDLRSTLVPYFLQQRDALQRRVQKQEAENRQLADAVLAGRRQVEELQLQVQARQQAWQALHSRHAGGVTKALGLLLSPGAGSTAQSHVSGTLRAALLSPQARSCAAIAVPSP
ncbi:polyamine-modulated factor 1 isoform X4 [Camelus bactrianus]|uniref:Polyamine-modulated factor 1 isoform X4 n=1 Tax=Camelus bactrianus TaxID=9837 RepID=A0AC58P6L2_CAMBA